MGLKTGRISGHGIARELLPPGSERKYSWNTPATGLGHPVCSHQSSLSSRASTGMSGAEPEDRALQFKPLHLSNWTGSAFCLPMQAACRSCRRTSAFLGNKDRLLPGSTLAQVHLCTIHAAFLLLTVPNASTSCPREIPNP